MVPQYGGNLQNELSDLISGFVREFRLLEKDEISCYGVTISQQYVVQELARAGKLTMNELSERMSVATSTMTRIIDNLVRDGIIERIRDEQDRRIVQVALTNRGGKLAKELDDCVDTLMNAILTQIPPEKQKDVLESFKLLVTAIRKGNERCCK